MGESYPISGHLNVFLNQVTMGFILGVQILRQPLCEIFIPLGQNDGTSPPPDSSYPMNQAIDLLPGMETRHMIGLSGSDYSNDTAKREISWFDCEDLEKTS